MKVIAINGYPQSGKSTFVEFIKKWNKPTLELSMVDLTKKVAKAAGWAGEKEPADRRFLAHLKDLLEEWRDRPYQYVYNQITGTAKHYKEDFVDDYFYDNFIVFVHAREAKDIDRLKEDFGAKALLIKRDEVDENEQSNHADKAIDDYEYDYTITNNEGLEQLEDKARVFISLILDKPIR